MTEEESKSEFRPMPEERLQEILSILFPYGYSAYDGKYTGISPYIGSDYNIITIVANDSGWWECDENSSGVFNICMEQFTDDGKEDDSLGYYKGIMKVIAPELHSRDEIFKGGKNVLTFGWANDYRVANQFPVDVTFNPNKLKKIK